MPSLPPPLALTTARSRAQVILGVLLPVLSTILLIGRYVSRRVKRVSLGPDDYMMIPAMFAIYTQSVIIIMSAYYGGIGLHIEDVSPENYAFMFKLLAAVLFSFGTSLGLVKVSICLLLIRIFPIKNFRIVAYIVMAYCVCWMLMVISIGAGLCRPFAFNWEKSIPGGRCGNQDGAYISIAALDIIGDLAIIALPMPLVWRLKMKIATKIGLTILFALGFLDVAVAILRIIYLTRISFAPHSDFTWDAAPAYAWSVVEPSLGGIVANAAVLMPAFEIGVHYSKNLWSRLASTTSASLIERSQWNYQRRPDRSDLHKSSGESVSEIPLHAVRQTVEIDISSNPK